LQPILREKRRPSSKTGSPNYQQSYQRSEERYEAAGKLRKVENHRGLKHKQQTDCRLKLAKIIRAMALLLGKRSAENPMDRNL
jgi:hypothetical protein